MNHLPGLAYGYVELDPVYFGWDSHVWQSHDVSCVNGDAQSGTSNDSELSEKVNPIKASDGMRHDVGTNAVPQILQLDLTSSE